MFRKIVPAILMSVMLGVLIPSFVYAFTYQTQTQNITQTIRNVMSETLRPNGSGSSTQFTPYPYGNANWQCVDEVTSDEDATYVYTTDYIFYDTDLYATQDHSGSGTIKQVTVWIRARATSTFFGGSTVKTAIRTYSTNYYGTAVTLTTSYADYSTVYTTNPKTGQAWTWEEIDAIQIGVRGLSAFATTIRCTQVWLVVEYMNT